MPPVKKSKEAKQIDALTKKYQCVDGVVVPRDVKTRQKNPWNSHLSEFYKKEKAKNPSYTYAEAMKDSRSSYNPVVKTTRKAPESDTKNKAKFDKALEKLIKITQEVGQDKASGIITPMMPARILRREFEGLSLEQINKRIIKGKEDIKIINKIVKSEKKKKK
jgi:hypothetical protein